MGAFVNMRNKALSKKADGPEQKILRDDRRRQFDLLHTLAEELGITLKPGTPPQPVVAAERGVEKPQAGSAVRRSSPVTVRDEPPKTSP